MFKRFILGVVVVLLSLGMSSPVLAVEKGEGVIRGSLVNKTAGGKNVADVPLTLKIYLNNAETGSSTAKTDNDGNFTFNNLVTAQTNSYQITLTYQEAEYNSERLTFAAGETVKTVLIAVYDATTSDAAIRITNAHTIILTDEKGVLVKEYYQFMNDSDKTYIGTGDSQDTKTLRFNLPKDAKNLEYGLDFMECCAVLGDGVVADSMDILPGPREMLVAYRLSPSSGTYDYAQKMFYPVGSYNLLTQSGVIQVASDKLAPGQPLKIEGTSVNTYNAKSVSAGDVVTARLSNLPVPANQLSSLKWVAVAIALLAGAAGFIFLMKRKKQAPQPQPVKTGMSFSNKKQKLLLELAKLDDDFERGEIEESIYRKLRAEKKQQLIMLMQGSRR